MKQFPMRMCEPLATQSPPSMWHIANPTLPHAVVVEEDRRGL
jgi:hypothetical protein